MNICINSTQLIFIVVASYGGDNTGLDPLIVFMLHKDLAKEPVSLGISSF